VHIAVAKMAEGQRPRPRANGKNQGVGAGDEIRNFADRHRNIVFDAATFKLLCLRDRFAQAPEGAGLGQGVGKRGIDDKAFSLGAVEDVL